jgi:hypothetical protein
MNTDAVLLYDEEDMAEFISAYLPDSSFYSWEDALEEAQSRDRRAAMALEMSVLYGD